jgi:hypothetical protein
MEVLMVMVFAKKNTLRCFLKQIMRQFLPGIYPFKWLSVRYAEEKNSLN